MPSLWPKNSHQPQESQNRNMRRAAWKRHCPDSESSQRLELVSSRTRARQDNLSRFCADVLEFLDTDKLMLLQSNLAKIIAKKQDRTH